MKPCGGFFDSAQALLLRMPLDQARHHQAESSKHAGEHDINAVVKSRRERASLWRAAVGVGD